MPTTANSIAMVGEHTWKIVRGDNLVWPNLSPERSNRKSIFHHPPALHRRVRNRRSADFHFRTNRRREDNSAVYQRRDLRFAEARRSLAILEMPVEAHHVRGAPAPDDRTSPPWQSSKARATSLFILRRV